MDTSGTITLLVHEWVTGGGLAGQALPPSLAAEGAAMRLAIAREFAAAGVRVRVTLDERLGEEPGPWSVVRLPDAAPERLFAVAEEADYTLVIAPETAGVLAGLVRGLEAAGLRSLGCSSSAIDLAGDKSRMAHWLEERGFSTPAGQPVIPAAGLPRDARFPAVLKPIDGAGSLDTYRLDGPDELPARARSMGLALLQDCCPGIPMSASVLAGGGRADLLATGRQDVTVEGGCFRYHGGTLPVPCPAAGPSLARLVESIPGLRGLVGVDFLWDVDRREAIMLDVNPRPTTSIVGLCRLLPAGLLARAWLAACGVPGFQPSPPGAIAASMPARVRARFDAAGGVELIEAR